MHRGRAGPGDAGCARAGRAGCAALAGTAEALPLDDGSVDAVVVAQAFHWFDGPAAVAEFHRVLRPGGRFGLIWNRAAHGQPLHREVDAIIEPLPPRTRRATTAVSGATRSADRGLFVAAGEHRGAVRAGARRRRVRRPLQLDQLHRRAAGSRAGGGGGAPPGAWPPAPGNRSGSGTRPRRTRTNGRSRRGGAGEPGPGGSRQEPRRQPRISGGWQPRPRSRALVGSPS